jgi:hypothetical protein
MKIGAQRTLGSKVERVWMFVVVVAETVLLIFAVSIPPKGRVRNYHQLLKRIR